ncbi:MAG: hypothetical protein SFU87_14155 [Chitinophagaceae bacterium]|nr:hypothetical protein [Chitinophagaceae bacterium]
MKNGILAEWNYWLGIISTMILCLPVLIILYRRLFTRLSFAALGVYYTSTVAYNLMTIGIVKASAKTIGYVGLVNNLIDTPLMLLFLLFYSYNTKITKAIYLAAGLFIVFEIITVITMGISVTAITVILAPGLLLTLGLSLFFFGNTIKIIISDRIKPAKGLMVSAIAFSYSCFLILYILFYIVKTKNTDDCFFMYYLSSLISGVVMSAGLLTIKEKDAAPPAPNKKKDVMKKDIEPSWLEDSSVFN